MEWTRVVVIGSNKNTRYLLNRLQETAACELISIITPSGIAREARSSLRPPQLAFDHLAIDAVAGNYNTV